MIVISRPKTGAVNVAKFVFTFRDGPPLRPITMSRINPFQFNFLNFYTSMQKQKYSLSKTCGGFGYF